MKIFIFVNAFIYLKGRGAGNVTQWVQHPSVMLPASYTGVSVPVPVVPILMQLPADILKKAEEEGPSVLGSQSLTQIEFLAPGFGMT